MPTPYEYEGQIEVIQGSLGSGKSAVAMCECVEHLIYGGVVATNFDFVSDWAWTLSGKGLLERLGFTDRYKKAESLRSRAFKIGSLESINEISGPRGERMKKLCERKMGEKREAYGLLIIDEAHMFFNSRQYSQNKSYIEFFSQARKNGWRVLLVAHSIEMIDKQIRFFVELESRFRNLKKAKIPFTPFNMSPVPAFLIVRRYAGRGPGAGAKHSIDLRVLHKKIAKLYDSLEIFAFNDLDRKSSNQGSPISEIKEAREYYYRKHGEYPGIPCKKTIYKGNIRGEYSILPKGV